MSSVTERVGQRYLTAMGTHVYRVVKADAERYSIKLEECRAKECWGSLDQHPTTQMKDGLFTADTAGFDQEVADGATITWLEG